MRQIEICLNPLQLGPGEYTLGISICDYTPLEQINGAKRMDLLSRSFTFSVAIEDSLAAASASFFHSAEWQFKEAQSP